MREGYIGILLVFVFSVFAASFMMSLPDLRIYRNTVNMLNGLAIPARTIPETVDIDDAVVGSIVVLAVPESTIGMSFDAYRSARKSQDYARDMEKALIVAVQKDSPHEMKEFEFVRNQPLIDKIFDKWHFVSHLIDENETPTELENEEFKLDHLFTGPIAQ